MICASSCSTNCGDVRRTLHRAGGCGSEWHLQRALPHRPSSQVDGPARTSRRWTGEHGWRLLRDLQLASGRGLSMAVKRPRALDRIDVKILVALQRDGRSTMQKLAENVGLTARPCLER